MDFIQKHSLLYMRQYGFRDKMLTSMVIFELTESITSAKDNQESTLGIFIDLKKAFDTIDHSILLKKLTYYGIRGLASYLKDRSQYVTFNYETSDRLVMEFHKVQFLDPHYLFCI